MVIRLNGAWKLKGFWCHFRIRFRVISICHSHVEAFDCDESVWVCLCFDERASERANKWASERKPILKKKKKTTTFAFSKSKCSARNIHLHKCEQTNKLHWNFTNYEINRHIFIKKIKINHDSICQNSYKIKRMLLWQKFILLAHTKKEKNIFFLGLNQNTFCWMKANKRNNREEKKGKRRRRKKSFLWCTCSVNSIIISSKWCKRDN